jgi:subtilase family serine protease
MMRTSLRLIVTSLITSVALAACGGAPVVPRGPAQQAPLQPSIGSQSPANFSWGQQQLSRAQYVGPVTNGGISMSVAVKFQNEAGLLQYARQASDPHSAVYRRFLTPQEIGDRFGASLRDYRATAHYFSSYGISVGGWPQRLQLSLAGSVQQFSKAFGTQFGVYRYGKTTFISAMHAPHLSGAVPISAVVNMVQVPLEHSYFIRPSSADFIGYSPQMIGKIFDYTGAWANGITGRGITIGIIGTGPISAADVPAYGATFHTPVAGVTQMRVTGQPASTQNNNTGTGAFDPNPGGLTAPPPVTAPCNQTSALVPNYRTCNPEDGEAQLDTEQAASLAPGAHVDFYLAYNASTCVNTTTNIETAPPCTGGSVAYPLIGIQVDDDEIQQAIADNAVDVLSLSYGSGENSALDYYYDSSGQGVGPAEFAALAAEGIAVFVSSGDTGNQSCFSSPGEPLATPCVSYPASDPSVTAVGGVNAPADDAGNLIGQITAWADQTTGGGNGSFGNNVGSGGGVSQIFRVPPWQAGITTPANTKPPSPPLAGFRGVPDVALMADPGTGPAMLMDAAFGGIPSAAGGTSAAAPEMAAMWALVLQACGHTPSCAAAGGAHPNRLGNAAPMFYSIYRKAYAQTFFDVIYGENQATQGLGPPLTGCCTAGPGYDLVTGLGVPFAGHLIHAITGVTTP